jgi:hypothetical protein
MRNVNAHNSDQSQVIENRVKHSGNELALNPEHQTGSLYDSY